MSERRMGACKILVADDHEIVRHGIRTLLERSRPDWEVCAEATNGEEAIAAVKAFKPDIVVLDITMPIVNGLAAATEISRLGLKCRILVFTMHESERLVNEVRDAGAHGYVLKSHAARDLIGAIENLLMGGTFFDRQGPTQGSEGSAQRAGALFSTPDHGLTKIGE